MAFTGKYFHSYNNDSGKYYLIIVSWWNILSNFASKQDYNGKYSTNTSPRDDFQFI